MRFFWIVVVVILFAHPLFGQGKWTPFVTKINGQTPVAASFLNEQYGFVKTGRTYRTTDGGKTWIVVQSATPSFGGMEIYYYTPKNIFCNSFESNDSGLTWKPLVSPPPSGNLYIKDGIFYDASGYISYDHCLTWLQVNYFPGGETIRGNLDNSIAMWGSGKRIGVPTLYTVDGGKSWKNGQLSTESDFGYCIPFTNTYFRAGGDSVDAIVSSFDGGGTWNPSLGPVQSTVFSDGTAGDACVIYAQTMTSFADNIRPGLLRSTDIGNTWVGIGGPVSIGDDKPICGVTTRGSVCFAMSYNVTDTLWKYRDSTIYRPIMNDAVITKIFPDTLEVTECDSVKLKVQLAFAGCDFIRFHDLRIDSLSQKYFRADFKQDNVVRMAHPDSGTITIFPHIAGVFNLSVHVNLSSTDWSGADTTFPFVLIVKANPAKLAISSRDTIDFGSNPMCLGGRDTITLSNHSCDTLKIKDIRFEADSVSVNDFTLTQNAPYILQEHTVAQKILIDFNPQSLGEKAGRIILRTDNGNDTIYVHANVLPDARTLIVQTDSLLSPICDSSEGMLKLYNQSCRRMTLDSLSLPVPYRLLPIQFPVIIDPGNWVNLRVRFIPQQRGSAAITTTAKLSFLQVNDSVRFDTSITISGFATRGTSAYSLSTLSVTFDSLHLCDTALQRFVLYSTGCDSLTVRSITVAGDPDFGVSGPGKNNIQLAPGDSILMNISLHPASIGNKSATINLALDDSTNLQIPIAATVQRAKRILLDTSATVLDFGKSSPCQTVYASLNFTNPGCSPDTIFDIQISGTGFHFPTALPVIIPPGESKSLDLNTVLDTAGGVLSNTASVKFVSNADSALAPITLIRSYIYPHNVHLWLVGDKTPLTSGNIWKAKLKGRQSELTDIKSIDFIINYNTDLLTFLPTGSSLQSLDGKIFHITSFTAIQPSADSTIADIAFEVYLTKDTMTSLAMNSIVLNSFDPFYMLCIATPLATGIDFHYSDLCGDPSIRTFMKGEPLILGVHPNPAHDEVVVDIQEQIEQNERVEIFDALGVKVLSEQRKATVGRNEIHLNVKNLAQGTYILRVGNTSESLVISR